MESVANMRFVRCPKCSELLPEFSNVSIYQCGGCNTILRAKNYTSNNEKTIIESSETNSYHEKDESTDVALEITSVFSLSMEDENWSYQNNSRSSSFENSSQTSIDKCDLGSPDTKKRNDSSMQNTPPGEENEYTSNSSSSSNQNSKSNREIVFGVHSRNSSISTNRKSKKSLGSESFYSVRSRFECENEVMSFDSPSTSLNNRMELLKTAEKLKNQLESVCKTTEQNKRMYKFLIENANSGSSKRYVLPVSKGAPFVICYKCLQMLHIPVYFLKKTRRLINKLKCGSCLEVLRLQLPFRSNEKLRASTENSNFSEINVDSVSIDSEVFVCESSGAEIEPELQASKDAPEVKYTLHQLMGYLSARMLLQ